MASPFNKNKQTNSKKQKTNRPIAKNKKQTDQ
jgi:hypothetical protein